MIPRIYLITVIVLVAAGFAVGGLAYPSLPNPVPIHWNMEGRADGYGPPWIDVLLFPIVITVLAGLLLGAPMIGRGHFARHSRAYWRMTVVALAMMLALHCVVLLKATGRPVRIERALPLIIGIAVAVMGNWMGKIRRNYIMGIRTPWTLSNDLVWERTHRAGGKLMVAYGLAVAAAGLFAPPLFTVAIVVVGTLALVTWAMLYSHSISRRLGQSGT